MMIMYMLLTMTDWSKTMLEPQPRILNSVPGDHTLLRDNPEGKAAQFWLVNSAGVTLFVACSERCWMRR